MPWQAFLLDSNATGYAAALTALASYTNAKQSFTDAQVLRDASHDSTLKIVFANITEAEINGDADLVNLRAANFPSALCHDRWGDLQAFRERGFHTLGEHVRSQNPVLTGGLVYVAHFDEGETPGSGNSPFDPTSWFSVNSGGGLQPNTGYFRGGCIHRHQDGTISFAAQGAIGFTDGSAGDEVHIRDDHEFWPGVQSSAWLHTATSHPTYGSVGLQAWVQDGTNPNVWSQSDYKGAGASAYTGRVLAFGGDFPILGTSTEWHDDWILETVGSLADCRNTPSSCFHDPDGTTLHIHMHDGASPDATGRKILRDDNFGWHFDAQQATTGLAPKIRFINNQDFGHTVGGLILSSGGDEIPDKISFEGGRWIWSSGSWFQNGGCSELVWKASSQGRILWDTSDRRNKPASEGVQIIINEHGTAADAYDDWERHVEIGWVTLGPHPSQTVGSGKFAGPQLFSGDGYYFHNIGNDTKDITRDHADNHCMALRIGYTLPGPQWKRGYLYNIANGFYWYAVSDAEGRAPVLGSTGSFNNYLVEDIVFDTWNGVNPTAGVFAGRAGGDNDAILQDDGIGGKRDGLMRRFVVLDFPPTGENIGSSPAQEANGLLGVPTEDGTCIRTIWPWRNDRAGHVQAFSSVQLVDNGVVDTDATETVIEGTNTPLTMPLTGTFVLALGRKQGTWRRAQIRLTQNGAGTAVLAFKYWDGLALQDLTVSDGTNNLTQSGTITFTKPGDWAADTVGTRECFHVYVSVASGSFTTDPIMDQCRGIQTGSGPYSRRVRLLELETPDAGMIWTRANQWTTSSGVIDLDDLTIRPKSGFTVATDPLCRFFSTGGQETLSEFQARTKLAANTDADQDSVFAPNVTVLAAL